MKQAFEAQTTLLLQGLARLSTPKSNAATVQVNIKKQQEPKPWGLFFKRTP